MQQPALNNQTTAVRSPLFRSMKALYRYKASYLMLLFPVTWYIIFKYIPMYGVIIAFKDFNLIDGIAGSSWANPWYKHFQTFYDSPYFVEVVGNTFAISIYRLLWGTLPPVILALLLNECRVDWLKRWVQTLSYMPYFLSWVIIYGILLAFLSPDGGLINRFIMELGGKPIPFLYSTEWFRTVLVSSNIWQDMGWGAIIYLAALTSIDPSLYEAARVDGAGRLRMIWHITLPGIRNVFIMLLILKLGHIMDAGFDQIYILYNIQVYQVADIIDTWVFRNGLEKMNFSLASAAGLFKSVIGLVLVYISNRLAKMGGEGIW